MDDGPYRWIVDKIFSLCVLVFVVFIISWYVIIIEKENIYREVMVAFSIEYEDRYRQFERDHGVIDKDKLIDFHEKEIRLTDL
jgi:hypothetical protein